MSEWVVEMESAGFVKILAKVVCIHYNAPEKSMNSLLSAMGKIVGQIGFSNHGDRQPV